MNSMMFIQIIVKLLFIGLKLLLSPFKKLLFFFALLKTGKQIITIHILLNISRSKVNQIMKFGQLIEYPVRNFFLKKSCRK